MIPCDYRNSSNVYNRADSCVARLRRDVIMATRTAPAVTGAVSSTILSLGLVDASGDKISEAIVSPSTYAVADIETWAAAYQASSQASLWRVTYQSIWEGDIDPQNADVGQRNSVKSGVNLLWKNLTTLKTQTPRLVAPIAANMQGNQDIPLLTSTEFTALIAAYTTLLSGYTLRETQYTDRRERKNNPRIVV